MNVLAGCDFFTVEVLTWRGLVTYYVLFFLHLESRRVSVARITRHLDQEWMEQVGRSATQEARGTCGPQKLDSVSRSDLLQPVLVVQSTEHSLASDHVPCRKVMTVAAHRWRWLDWAGNSRTKTGVN
jgi:hypothetical protein